MTTAFSGATDSAQSPLLYSFDDAAKILGIGPIDVARLVAKEILPQPVLIGGLQKRIGAEALKEYIRNGAFGAGSALKHDGRWFTGNDLYPADDFASLLATLARADLPQNQAEIREYVTSKLSGLANTKTIDMPIGLNDKMRRAIFAPASDPRYTGGAGQAFAASRARRILKTIITKDTFDPAPLQTLYSDPFTYKELTAKAISTLRTVPAFSATSFLTAGPTSPQYAVSFYLPMSTILDIIPGRLADVAF
jgi:hypothetical protein